MPSPAIGAGVVYGTAIGSALKWFPDHRGLAAGLTAAGFGAGSAFTVTPIANLINTAGYQTAFIQWGIIQGAVVVIAALFLHPPPEGWLPGHWKKVDAGHDVKKRQTGIEFTSFQMAATPQFWLMYLMMTLVATGGLMAVAQLNPMAIDYKVDQVPVKFLFITLPAIQFALSADRLVNGLCRPFWGWVSDHIGREKTMTVAFGLEAIAIFVLINFAHNPVAFVVFSAFTFFGWGEIFSLFPALTGDFFGRKHATANYGFLYTAKGTASVLVPIGSALAAGKAFDFRADFLLLLGGALAVFAHFVGPVVLRLRISRRLHNTLLYIGLFLVTYGICLTVVPAAWTPFAAKFTLPKIGWAGVFTVAIVFDTGGGRPRLLRAAQDEDALARAGSELRSASGGGRRGGPGALRRALNASGWSMVFIVWPVLNFFAAFLALLVLSRCDSGRWRRAVLRRARHHPV